MTFTDPDLGNGAVASYSCERGFELLGPARRVCDSGNWVPEGIPFCGKLFLYFYNLKKKKLSRKMREYFKFSRNFTILENFNFFFKFHETF